MRAHHHHPFFAVIFSLIFFSIFLWRLLLFYFAGKEIETLLLFCIIFLWQRKRETAILKQRHIYATVGATARATVSATATECIRTIEAEADEKNVDALPKGNVAVAVRQSQLNLVFTYHILYSSESELGWAWLGFAWLCLA